MNIEYIGHDFIIDCQNHSVVIANKTSVIRPKTFELLLSLIEHSNQVVSKQWLLETIWDDVNVDEHVIVQSIAELRKIFKDQKVIQTHPRKGYSWVANCDKRTVNQLSTTTPTQADNTKDTTRKPEKKRQLKLYVFSIIVIVVATVLLLWLSFKKHTPLANNQTVFILPTKNSMMDSKFNWVSLGIMDTLISHAHDNSNIMPIDYVLSSMQLVKMERHYNDEQLARFFKITDAHTVVESELSRRLDEYQLVYRFHQQNNVKRGVLFDKSLDDLIASFADLIGEFTSMQQARITLKRSPFNHELLVEAISLAKEGKLSSAILLIKSLITIEPDNLMAYRLLIDWLQYNHNFTEALKYTTASLAYLDNNDNEKASFYYRHAYTLFRLQRLEEAWHYSTLLKEQLTFERNPLYYGYSSQLAGEILFAQQNNQAAKEALLLALQQFEQISFSIGMTTVHILLSKVESELGDEQLSEKHLQTARDIVQKYEIQALIKTFRIDL